MTDHLTRRELLSLGALALAGASGGAFPRALPAEKAEEASRAERKAPDPFPVSLNTSTLRGHKLPVTEVVDIAARAGYAGIEPWPDELDRHVQAGGTLKDLDRRLKDHGLKVTGAIAFFAWMVDDDSERARAFEEAKRRMEMLAQIGGSHIAAPPAGNVEKVDLLKAAERYRALLELSEPFGVTPALELWGGARNLSRLGQCACIAVESGHPKACILPDVFHLYRGGSGLAGIRLLSPGLIAGFHLNDYPADPPRERARDSDRVYPGDGVAPLEQLFKDLKTIGYRGAVSVELFNPTYYAQDPAVVARTALEKTRAVIEKALGGA